MSIQTNRRLATIVTLIAHAACGVKAQDGEGGHSSSNGGGPPASSNNGGGEGAGVVGLEAIAAWDALGQAQKAEAGTTATLFLHQSVGQDLEDGAAENGISFEYFGPDQASVVAGLNGGIFTDVAGLGNGEPTAKVEAWKTASLAHKSTLEVTMMKFGYADVMPELLEAGKMAYQAAVSELKAAGLTVLHVTPPLVYDVAENQAKMDMRQWMLSTFTGDVIFDFQDIESTEPSTGTRCEDGGVWRICEAVRSREACPSKGQGIDGPGQGHLCSTESARIAKAMLFSIRQAGQ